MRVFLELGCASVHRAFSALVACEDPNHSICDLAGDVQEVLITAGIAGNRQLEIVSIPRAQGAQRLDYQKCCWEPDRPAPVRIASLYFVVRLSGVVANLPVFEDEGMLAVVLREAADPVVRQKFVWTDDLSSRRRSWCSFMIVSSYCFFRSM